MNQLLRFLNVIIVLALIGSSQSRAEEQTCVSILNEIKGQNFSNKTNLDIYRTIRLLKISDIFNKIDSVELPNGGIGETAHIDSEYETRFRKIFDQYLDYLRHYEKYDVTRFRKWLQKTEGGPYPQLNPEKIRYFYYDSTFEQFFNEYHLRFLAEKKNETYQSNVQKPAFRSALDYTILKIRNSTRIVFTTIFVFGLAMPMSQVILKPMLDPVIQVTEQISRSWQQNFIQFEMQELGQFQRWMNTVSISPVTTADAAEVNHVASELRSTNFSGMSPEAALKTWEAFDARFSVIFQRRNKTLPPNQQAGRDILKGYLLDIPLSHAGYLSTFRVHYMLAENSLSTLEQNIKARGTPATQEEKEKIRLYKEDMASAEARIAATIASFKINRFMFSEVGRDLTPEEKEKIANLDNLMAASLNDFAHFMHFDTFTNELADQIQKAMLAIDPTLPNVPALSK
jgi:hypothetical protein